MHKPKYKVGDYLSHQESVFIEVLDVVPGSSPSETLYEIQPHNIAIGHEGKEKKTTWETEFELDAQGLEKNTPNFEAWETVQPGEYAKMSPLPNATIIKIINRRGDDIMLSETPVPRSVRKAATAAIDVLSSQIEELTNGDMTTEDVDRLKPMLMNSIGKTSSNSYKSAHGHWHTTREIALMNWILMRE